MKDLHIHTKYSDGEYNEYEIIEKIKKTKITEFSICDHDTIEGSQKVYNLLKKENSKLIFHTGIELSCRINNYLNGIDIHLLVRDFEYNNKSILFFMHKMNEFRLQKIEIMSKRIKERFHFDIPKEDIQNALNKTNSFGKPHMYKILTKYKDIDREEYYKQMKHLDTGHLKLDAFEVLNELKNSTCYVTLAHPIEIMDDYHLDYTDIDNLVKTLKEAGLKGLETKHSKHTKKDYLEFSKIAKKHNLIETEGSDFHGPTIKPTVHLGICEKI